MFGSLHTVGDVFFLILTLTLILAAIILLFIVVGMLFKINNIIAQKEGREPVTFDSMFGQWYKGLTNAVPIEREASIEMNHSYDGIRELDNHLPPWWTALFIGTIVFGVFYVGIYHVWGMSPLQEDEYNEELTLAQKQIEEFEAKNAAKIDENSVKNLASDASVISKGKEVFATNCVACHGASGEGGVGPNLTDDFWLHGDGGISDVFKVIKNGVPEKGMISWKATLKPEQIQSVSNYILSIKGTNPANAKAPQGEKVAIATDSTQTK